MSPSRIVPQCATSKQPDGHKPAPASSRRTFDLLGWFLVALTVGAMAYGLVGAALDQDAQMLRAQAVARQKAGLR
ncbi:MAG TPA: hypothetical protein VGN26_04025 [Armatimonadota bacterium]|jgi:hypothetical protein